MFFNKKPKVNLTKPTPAPIVHSDYHPVDPKQIRGEFNRTQTNTLQYYDDPNQEITDAEINRCLRKRYEELSNYKPPYRNVITTDDDGKEHEVDDTSYLETVSSLWNGAPRHQGYFVNKGCMIETVEAPIHPGIISAMPFITIENANGGYNFKRGTANVINTENGGFRYVDIDPEDEYYNAMHDFGHVEHACIFGNVDNPDGVYVPLNSRDAMIDGIRFLDATIRYIDHNEMMLEETEHEHKCSCGGHCNGKCNGSCGGHCNGKCDGSCGGNCKCHK